MQTESYTGIGLVFQAQDLFATETAGPIQDRSQEHLTPNDIPLVISRKLLLKGIKDVEEGRDPPHVLRDPARNHFPPTFAASRNVPYDTDWKAYFKQLDAERETELAAAMPT